MTDTANTAGADETRPSDRTKITATSKRDDVPADKKIGFFGRIILFIKQTIAEMKKVVYPSKEELWTYFLVVVVFVAIMMTFTGVVDMGFAKLSTLVFA